MKPSPVNSAAGVPSFEGGPGQVPGAHRAHQRAPELQVADGAGAGQELGQRAHPEGTWGHGGGAVRVGMRRGFVGLAVKSPGHLVFGN